MLKRNTLVVIVFIGGFARTTYAGNASWWGECTATGINGRCPIAVDPRDADKSDDDLAQANPNFTIPETGRRITSCAAPDTVLCGRGSTELYLCASNSSAETDVWDLAKNPKVRRYGKSVGWYGVSLEKLDNDNLAKLCDGKPLELRKFVELANSSDLGIYSTDSVPATLYEQCPCPMTSARRATNIVSMETVAAGYCAVAGESICGTDQDELGNNSVWYCARSVGGSVDTAMKNTVVNSQRPAMFDGAAIPTGWYSDGLQNKLGYCQYGTFYLNPLSSASTGANRLGGESATAGCGMSSTGTPATFAIVLLAFLLAHRSRKNSS